MTESKGMFLKIARQESTRRKMYPLLSKVYFAVVIVALLDFVLLLAFSFYIGGDAVNGKIENGKYFVFGVRSENQIKVYTEVSKTVFDYSRWQVYSVWVTWSAMFLGTLLYKRLPSGD